MVFSPLGYLRLSNVIFLQGFPNALILFSHDNGAPYKTTLTTCRSLICPMMSKFEIQLRRLVLCFCEEQDLSYCLLYWLFSVFLFQWEALNNIHISIILSIGPSEVRRHMLSVSVKCACNSPMLSIFLKKWVYEKSFYILLHFWGIYLRLKNHTFF